MKIGLITYDRPHRKTYDVACLLKMHGHNDVTLLMTPFEERRARRPLIQHRPSEIDIRPRTIANALQYDLTWHGKTECDVYLVGGCNVIPGLKALNAHPGYPPYTRGLDSLKWAIYHGVPTGVTVHETTDEVDQGPIYMHEIIPLYFEDTFHSFAERMYQAEITMLVESLFAYKIEIEIDDYTPLSSTANKRMPAYKERIMLERFESMRKTSKSIYT